MLGVFSLRPTWCRRLACMAQKCAGETPAPREHGLVFPRSASVCYTQPRRFAAKPTNFGNLRRMEWLTTIGDSCLETLLWMAGLMAAFAILVHVSPCNRGMAWWK